MTGSTRIAVRRFRMNFLFGTLLVLMALLLARLGQLQLVDAAQYRAKAESKHRSAWLFQPRRGRLLDRHGTPLAVPKPARKLGIDPSQIHDPRTFALVLSDLLGGEPRPWQIENCVRKAQDGAHERGEPVPQYRVLVPFTDDPTLVDRIDDLARIPIRRKVRLGIYGVVVEPAEGRHYPNGSYAAHVLGQMPRPDGAAGTGAEEAFDAVLTGSAQRVTLYRDGRRRAYAKHGLGRRLAASGRDVRLTLDITIQHALESALDDLIERWTPLAACGVVLDPHTGDVLALAGRPDFDPNRHPANANPAIQGLFEPGSFFKPFTVGWALGHGVVKPDEELAMPGSVLLKHEKQAIRDSHFVGPGTVARLIAHSSNTGSAELGDRLGPERMRALFRRTFPGREHGADSGLPYERGARVALPSQDKAWPWWLTHRAAYGQGFRVTPLQMAASFAAFARADRRIVQPRLFLDDDRPAAPGAVVCKPEHLAVIRAGLEACVSEGTARKAFDGAPFRAAAKTATAQQWGTHDGRRVLLGNCSLVAYAPAENPQVVVLVLAQLPDDAGGFGGSVAGPAVRTILERVLAYWDVTS
ncbi:MAG: penicillin-binding transpeptidase domain-containing protein [Planctomycetota bacterium]|nr:penicillin-binding transpeptidase domain-containing protein [Planctomycetota bacterium]